MQLSNLASIPIRNTLVFDVVWRSDCQVIFSTPQNDSSRYFFFEPKGLQIQVQRVRIV